MSRAGRLLLILGIFISLMSGLTVFVLLTLSQAAPPEVATAKVVLAFQNIAPRTEIVGEQVGVTDWPRAVPTPVGAFEKPADVIGKLATTQVYQGQPIVAPLLIDKGQIKETHSNAALILENGSVAKAFPVNIVSSVAEALQAGDRVDVIATFTGQGTGSGTMATQRLLGDVLILQVGTWPIPGKAPASGAMSVITLQLKEQDALVLEYTVQRASAITLVLRPANDHEMLVLDPVTFEYINQRYGYKLPIR